MLGVRGQMTLHGSKIRNFLSQSREISPCVYVLHHNNPVVVHFDQAEHILPVSPARVQTGDQMTGDQMTGDQSTALPPPPSPQLWVDGSREDTGG